MILDVALFPFTEKLISSIGHYVPTENGKVDLLSYSLAEKCGQLKIEKVQDSAKFFAKLIMLELIEKNF